MTIFGLPSMIARNSHPVSLGSLPNDLDVHTWVVQVTTKLHLHCSGEEGFLIWDPMQLHMALHRRAG